MTDTYLHFRLSHYRLYANAPVDSEPLSWNEDTMYGFLCLLMKMHGWKRQREEKTNTNTKNNSTEESIRFEMSFSTVSRQQPALLRRMYVCMCKVNRYRYRIRTLTDFTWRMIDWSSLALYNIYRYTPMKLSPKQAMAKRDQEQQQQRQWQEEVMRASKM